MKENTLRTADRMSALCSLVNMNLFFDVLGERHGWDLLHKPNPKSVEIAQAGDCGLWSSCGPAVVQACTWSNPC